MAKSIRRIKRDAARAKAKASVAGSQDENIFNGQEIPGTDFSRTSAPAMSPLVSLIQFGLVWIIIVVLASLASRGEADAPQEPVSPDHEAVQHRRATVNGFRIPRNFLGPYNSYPNPMNVTLEMQHTFHPVVKFPKIKNKKETHDEPATLDSFFDYRILDLTASSSTTQLATEDQREAASKRRKLFWQKNKDSSNDKGYAVGRYDENRVNLYQSDHYHNTNNQIDGYAGARTLHIGIDLEGPVGTNVYAFTDGVIHSAGYNADLGDYGNVIVVEHDLTGPCLNKKGSEREDDSGSCKVWALYGHLDAKSIKGKAKGKRVKKGQVLGRMGDIHENGGWMFPHVHFQLSIHPPATHDMPGVVALKDRSQALVDFPDPRFVLGPLY